MLCEVYRLINWCDFAGVSGMVLFIISSADLVINSINSTDFIIFFLDKCWFGDVAVKYANMTNMPPT